MRPVEEPPEAEVTYPFGVDPNIARARTLPAEIYRSAAVFDRARERIFARSWQPVGELASLKAPGRVVPLTMLEGCLDEPLVLTRAEDGEPHCLSNVCTHRGALVVEGEGHRQSLRCRYHGRRFGLDGRMRFMPEFEEAEGFPSPADDLPRAPLREWGPLFFASIDPGWPFEEWIAPVEERTDWLRPHRFILDPTRSSDYLIEANWALYCDNFLEGFHLPYVHGASLGDKIDYAGYRTELFDWCNVQVGTARRDEPAFDPPVGHPDEGERVAAWYFWLFPNIMLNFYPWGLSLNVVQPLSPSRTRVLFRSFVGDAAKLDQGAGAELHRIEMEDEEIVESAQRGVRSRLYDRGRYSPTREEGPHHFHRLLARFLAVWAALFCLAAIAAPADAQRRGRPQPAERGWPPILVGLHAGSDNLSNASTLGAHVVIPVLPGGQVELGGNADIFFLNDLRERQFNLDGYLYPLSWFGTEAGPYAGGGIGWRNTIFLGDTERSTRSSYSVVAGVRSAVVGPVSLRIEARWIFVEDVEYDSRHLTIGASFPLWGRGSRGPFQPGG
ncbi:MAG: Rieske 2Fe-2S domain-containing protein [Gemmatimonadetes bacterium]|nr:Rieske 2Fe-2S domain-containing protein [Gemmatimonadota bacterium]